MSLKQPPAKKSRRDKSNLIEANFDIEMESDSDSEDENMVPRNDAGLLKKKLKQDSIHFKTKKNSSRRNSENKENYSQDANFSLTQGDSLGPDAAPELILFKRQQQLTAVLANQVNKLNNTFGKIFKRKSF